MEINESTIAHLWTMMHGMVPSIKTIGIITAENPIIGYVYDEKSPVSGVLHNRQRNALLKQVVQKDGYGYIQIGGRYGNFENPILIQNISRDEMIRYCKLFGQEAVIWADVSNSAHLIYEMVYVNNLANNRIRNVFIKHDKILEPLPQIKAALEQHGYILKNYNDGVVIKNNVKEQLANVLFRIDPKLFDDFNNDIRRVTDYYSEYKGKKFQIPFFDDKIADPNDPTKEIPNPKTTIGKKFVHKKMSNGLDNTVIESRFDKAFRKVMESIGEYPQTMTEDEMIDFLIDNNTKNFAGEMDWNDVKHIAGYADKWILKNIDPRKCGDWSFPPKKKDRKLPIVVIGDDTEGYEVLDGKHRVAEANYRGDKTIQAYVGEI